MPWNSRIVEAAYTSPGGTRLTFLYENVSQSVSKKTTGREFPDVNGTYVQDLGHSGRRFPLRLIFWGDDCDLEAEAFDAVLLETGTGKLEHPIYGTKNVVPFGDITRRDDLKTAANQAIIEVTFWETIELIYPTAQGDPASEVATSVDEYNAAAAAEFENSIILDTVNAAVTLKNDVVALVDSVQSGLEAIAAVQAAVEKQFNAIVDSINTGIDVLIDQPLAMAFQITQMIQAPARALASIKARLSAYKDLATALISGDGADVSNVNELRTRDLYVSSYVTGSVLSVINNQFLTKTEAIEAAEEILEQLEAAIAWRDAQFEALGEVDTGGAYQKLQNAVAIVTGFLVEISFTLKNERRIVLDRDRTIIDLAAEIYGTVDEDLDFLIASNDLSGSEILELPAGRTIKYYT